MIECQLEVEKTIASMAACTFRSTSRSEKIWRRWFVFYLQRSSDVVFVVLCSPILMRLVLVRLRNNVCAQ